MNGKDVSICIEEIAENGDCALEKSKFCGSGLTCNAQAKCEKVPQVGHLEACGGSTGKQCDPQAHLCVSVSANAKNGYCFEKCDPTTKDCTTADGLKGNCANLSSGGGACLPVGTGKPQTLCGGEHGAKYQTALGCQADSVCVTFAQNAPKGLCLESKTSCGPPDPCGTGFLCLKLTSGAGVCGKTCTANTDCGTGQECTGLQGQTSKVCIPAPPSGNVAFGGKCVKDSTNPAEMCVSGILCLLTATTHGFCTKRCTADTDCPQTPTAGATCAIQLQDQTKVCGWGCGQPGQTCPTGMTCNTTQGICVP